MNERICSVFVFLICTTAPFTASPWALFTVPCTERMLAFSFFLSARLAAAVSKSAHITAITRRLPLFRNIDLLPILFGFFLFRVVDEILVLVFFHFLFRFQLERI